MSDASEKTAREAMEKSRIEVMKCEEEIKIIKNGIKAAVAKANNSNSLNVSVHKVKSTSADEGGSGEEDTAADDNPTTFKVHLSSPIEERTITQLFDPLNPTADESLAIFESVETSNALLTVEAYSDKDASTKVGVSAAHDLLPLCQDMELWRKGGEKKTTTLEIAIVAEKGIDDVEKEEDKKVDISADSESWEDAVEEEIEKDDEDTPKEDAPKEETETDEKKDDTPKEETGIYKKKDETPATATDESVEKESPAQDESKASASTIQLPLYTLTIQLEYTPSSNDLRDSLYEALNEVSKRKVAAIESLRKNAGLVNRAKASEASASGGSGEVVKSPGPAVKAGFLNKKPSEAAQPFWKRWYNKTIGPQSMLWVVGPITKNYIIFAGVSLFIHWKGDLLALPAPL